MVHIKQVDVHRINSYLAKYLTKELMDLKYYDQYRRFSTSRDIRLFPPSKKGEWSLIQVSLEHLLERLGDGAQEVTADGNGELEWFEVPIVPLE